MSSRPDKVERNLTREVEVRSIVYSHQLSPPARLGGVLYPLSQECFCFWNRVRFALRLIVLIAPRFDYLTK